MGRECATRDRLGYRAFTVLIVVNAAAAPTGTLAWTMPDDDPEDLADA